MILRFKSLPVCSQLSPFKYSEKKQLLYFPF